MTLRAHAEPRIPDAGAISDRRMGRALGTGARCALAVAFVLAALLAGFGWLYVLRGLGWLRGGPGVPDSLPLLQLAGFDVQPLGRVLVAWLAAGIVAGFLLINVRRLWRALFAGAAALILLLLGSQAAFALTRNLRLSDVIWSRRPGLGPWLEALLFAVGCAIPGRLPRALRAGDRPGGAGGRLAWPRFFGDRSLSSREDGDAREHERDSEHMAD